MVKKCVLKQIKVRLISDGVHSTKTHTHTPMTPNLFISKDVRGKDKVVNNRRHIAHAHNT